MLAKSPWFAALAAVGMDGWALYILFTGQVQIDKKGAFIATRSATPGAYWLAWLFIATFGVLLSVHAWRLITRKDP
jgi:hypothetical protein